MQFFTQSGHRAIRVGTSGVICLVAYEGANPAQNLLRRNLKLGPMDVPETSAAIVPAIRGTTSAPSVKDQAGANK
jgi:hypothetical protein